MGLKFTRSGKEDRACAGGRGVLKKMLSVVGRPQTSHPYNVGTE